MDRWNMVERNGMVTNEVPLFGYLKNNGVEWNGMVTNEVPLFGYFKNEWNEMGYDRIHSIIFFHLLSLQFVVYRMESYLLCLIPSSNTQTLEWILYSIMLHFTPLSSIKLSSF